MTKFIKGGFYSHNTSEFEFTDNHIEYVYCNDVRNEAVKPKHSDLF